MFVRRDTGHVPPARSAALYEGGTARPAIRANRPESSIHPAFHFAVVRMTCALALEFLTACTYAEVPPGHYLGPVR